ncbi:hypothetical protein AVEN_178826-1 [Araneus ventricosus]|uniref:Uncharacterized protein n=1 Tax=Araneus ventricosus TaxID=182803 RepID=A0A4Y2BFR9_ARAVE|nr:hypothetical protein AVEN_178826-1 [Araneus ventricosus]
MEEKKSRRYENLNVNTIMHTHTKKCFIQSLENTEINHFPNQPQYNVKSIKLDKFFERACLDELRRLLYDVRSKQETIKDQSNYAENLHAPIPFRKPGIFLRDQQY